MTSKLVQTLKEGYEALAQQFDFYRLLDQHQAFLVEHKPNGWQEDYDRLEQIKRYTTFGMGFSEGYTIGGYHNPNHGAGDDADILKIHCTELFKPTEGNGQ